MKKKILIVLTIISLLLIGFVIFAEISINNEVSTGSNVYIDGTDFTEVTQAFLEISACFLSIIVMIFGILAVACVWSIYGIIMLILWIIKKYKNKKNA